QADLDRDALCGAEFVIGHGATPYRNGRVLHSVFAAAGNIRRKFGVTSRRVAAIMAVNLGLITL
ncbi:hypothetical protein MX623_25260, partial [Pseudomonas aeruginosa]|nr:hypothetical protein [Pseudomonas aeruginosa]